MDDAGWCVTAVAMDLVAVTDVVAAEIDFYLLERQRQCCQCVLLSHMQHHHSPCLASPFDKRHTEKIIFINGYT